MMQSVELEAKSEEDVKPLLIENKMSDRYNERKKIGPYASRSERNAWAVENEDLVRSLSPWPITYDVGAIQGNDFSEFTYTEFAGGGIWVNTQSREINCRLIDFASKVDSGKEGEELFEKFVASFSDKYVMEELDEKYKNIKHVVFLPGHNLLDLVDTEALTKLLKEEDDVQVKPHPLTHGDAIRLVSRKCGWQKVLPKNISGAKLLEQCETVYSTTASEMIITGAALGKTVYDLSVYSASGAGVYQPIHRIISYLQKREGKEAAKKAIANIIACPWSGVVFKFHDNYEERIKMYFDKALELRELYRPLSCGRGDLDKKKDVKK
jgi:hypothetical protein